MLIMNEPLINQLMLFGLNHLEAEVYIDLLQNQESTGYAIGQRIGKATANVYKAVEALRQIGAIQISEEGKSKLCQAIPPDIFVAQLQSRFERRKTELLTSLKEIAVEEKTNDKIYRVDSVDLILQKAREMLNNCQTIAVVDAFPKSLALLRPELEAAIRRNVRVIIQMYAPFELDGAVLTLIPSYEANLEVWNSEQLNIITDAKESLLALMSKAMSEVYQSVWSESVYLAFVLHAGLIRENDAHQILNLSESPDYFMKTQSILAIDGRFLPEDVPGLKEMFDRFGPKRRLNE